MGVFIGPNNDDNIDSYIDDKGQERRLGKLAPDAEKTRRFRTFRSVYPLVPRSQWKPIDRRTTLGARFIPNQRSHGSCVGFSAISAMMRTRALRGFTFAMLSGAYVYSWINGGRDQGAMITDALDILKTKGTCLESTVGWDEIYRSQTSKGDAEAQRFKMREGIVIETFDEAVSALILGNIPQFAIQVGGNFEAFDTDGIAGFSNGAGNHSVIADGLKLSKSGLWILDMPNSWGTGFGQEGRCFLTERHFSSVQQDAFIHLDQDLDPNDPTNPVFPVG